MRGYKDLIRYPDRRDLVLASQERLKVRAIKEASYNRHSVVFSDTFGNRDTFLSRYKFRHITADKIDAFGVAEITDIYNINYGDIVYETKVYTPGNSDAIDVVINGPKDLDGGEMGFCSLGEIPIIAKLESVTTAPVVGSLVGPLRSSLTLNTKEPGFRILGELEKTEDLFWVLRDRGPGTGEGVSVALNSSFFELNNVTFSNGFNTWDGISGSFRVFNTFTDEFCAGQIVQFKWDVSKGNYVVTDIECC